MLQIYLPKNIFSNKNKFYLCISDSDDSDNEGGLGNVERVVMRPPGHSGKAKKGHLCFDAIYETGDILYRLHSSNTNIPMNGLNMFQH